MCGIAGFLNYDFSDEYFRHIHSIQRHRGPDHEGEWIEGNVAFYHQRLSIIDLSKEANQPFLKNDLAIILNGEIYNYKELRSDLETRHNIHFRTSSDTEVLLELYRIHQSGCLDLLRGMFAFAIYDQTDKSLFIARDHFGIKPLFYISNSEKFAFASELKTLLGLPGFDKTINYQSLVGDVNYLWVPGDESIFKNCHKLPAGHFMKINNNGDFKLQQYWSINAEKSVDSEDAIELLDSVLRDSVSSHMVADVPVSAFLSGGLDSSLLAVLAHRHTPLTTYTIKTQGKDQKIERMPDDARYAAKVARKFGLDHHEIEITPEITAELPHMVYHLDEPIGDPAAINTYLICKAARENGSKVLLSGMGADELFFGYRRQKATLLAMKYQNIPSSLRKIVTKNISKLPVRVRNRSIKVARWARRFETFANLPPSDAYMRSYSYYNDGELQNLFTADIEENIKTLHQSHHEIFNRHYSDDPINQMCYTDTQLFMQGLNLTYTDRASMAASVEVRVPFIDKEVVNLAMALDGNLKFKNRESKYILKKVAEKYLPKEIIYRPKASFGAPIRSWISGDLSEMVSELLSDKKVKERGIFNPIFVKDLIELDRKGKNDNAYQIYQLLSIELWFQEFVDK